VEVLTAAACLDLDISYHAMKNQVDSVIRERGLLEKEEKNPRKKRKKEQPKSNTSWRSKSFRPDT
jgi:K+-transporting ATPase c subunit